MDFLAFRAEIAFVLALAIRRGIENVIRLVDNHLHPRKALDLFEGERVKDVVIRLDAKFAALSKQGEDPLKARAEGEAALLVALLWPGIAEIEEDDVEGKFGESFVKVIEILGAEADVGPSRLLDFLRGHPHDGDVAFEAEVMPFGEKFAVAEDEIAFANADF